MEKQPQEHCLVKIGDIDEIPIYYDFYIKDNEVLLGNRDGKIVFMIGNSKDIKIYQEYYRKIDKRYNRDITIGEIIKD